MIQWLTGAGYRFEIAADGWPKVLRAAVEAKLLPTAGRRTVKKAEWNLPDYGAPAETA